MASTGLLVVSNVKHFGKTLRAIEKYVNSLYIHLNIPTAKTQLAPAVWGNLITKLYAEAGSRSKVDLRILVEPLKEPSSFKLQLKPVDMIFSDSHIPDLCESLRARLNISSQTIYLQQVTNNDILDFEGTQEAHRSFACVVLGGTFDRIHIGHKIFLTQAVLRACRRLVVGVTTAKMNKSKILSELILPVEQRIEEVQQFLSEIDNSLQYDIVPIDDPFGPTQSDPNMDMIVVSAETLRGGQKVNEIRAKNKLRALEIFCIPLVEGEIDTGPKEAKISSSNTRVDMLGTRLRAPEPRPNLPEQPYIIGLTGGIASGKSRMANRLQEMGAVVMDCDKIAHELYEPGQICFDKVVQHFGRDILASDGRIDRSKLGPIVFSDEQQLSRLNSIVWPELLLETKRRIQNLYAGEQNKVFVIEAAVLLKAGWETDCHEVWSMIVPADEAVRRVIERNGLTEIDARRRLANQLDNHEVVAKSNVVFSSQWDDAFTQQQAVRAWRMLMEELESKRLSNSSRL